MKDFTNEIEAKIKILKTVSIPSIESKIDCYIKKISVIDRSNIFYRLYQNKLRLYRLEYFSMQRNLKKLLNELNGKIKI